MRVCVCVREEREGGRKVRGKGEMVFTTICQVEMNVIQSGCL